jgi:hypothetical protein
VLFDKRGAPSAHRPGLREASSPLLSRSQRHVQGLGLDVWMLPTKGYRRFAPVTAWRTGRMLFLQQCFYYEFNLRY